MGRWLEQDLDDDLDDDGGAAPWALGHDDDPEPLERWDDQDDEAGDPWLDEQLDSLRSAGDPDLPTEAGRPRGDEAAGIVLRHPAPVRSPRRRRADPEAAADLPRPATPGYVRDRRGTWRYTATGRAVPGARDLTLRSLHRFPTQRGSVLVPVERVRREAELGWCLAWKHTLTTRMLDGHSVTVIAVPAGEWERRADIPIGLWAPELTASRLLAIGDVGRLAGVSSPTITAYLARGRMPEPVMRLGHTPVWTRPVIAQWLAARPGQGRRTPQRHQGRNR